MCNRKSKGAAQPPITQPLENIKTRETKQNGCEHEINTENFVTVALLLIFLYCQTALEIYHCILYS